MGTLTEQLQGLRQGEDIDIPSPSDAIGRQLAGRLGMQEQLQRSAGRHRTVTSQGMADRNTAALQGRIPAPHNVDVDEHIRRGIQENRSHGAVDVLSPLRNYPTAQTPQQSDIAAQAANRAALQRRLGHLRGVAGMRSDELPAESFGSYPPSEVALGTQSPMGIRMEGEFSPSQLGETLRGEPFADRQEYERYRNAREIARSRGLQPAQENETPMDFLQRVQRESADARRRPAGQQAGQPASAPETATEYNPTMSQSADRLAQMNSPNAPAVLRVTRRMLTDGLGVTDLNNPRAIGTAIRDIINQGQSLDEQTLSMVKNHLRDLRATHKTFQQPQGYGPESEADAIAQAILNAPEGQLYQAAQQAISQRMLEQARRDREQQERVQLQESGMMGPQQRSRYQSQGAAAAQRALSGR